MGIEVSPRPEATRSESSALGGAAGRPAETEEPQPGGRDWSPWLQAALLVLLTRALFFAIAFAAASFLASSAGPPTEGLTQLWSRWDASLFYGIAEHGYGPSSVVPNGAAFFPLFPITLRAGIELGLDPAIAGLLVNTIATFIATAFLFKLVRHDYDADTARRACLYLSFFPTAVFLVAPYSEPLFLAGAIAAFYFARTHQWSLVGYPAAVAMGARAAGVFLLFGLAWEFVRQRSFTRSRIVMAACSLLLGVLPLFVYGAFLEASTGNAFQFFVDQRNGWGRDTVGFVRSFLNTWNTWEGATYPTNWIFAWRMEVLAAAAGLVAVLWALKKGELGYAGYMGAFLVSLTTSTWYYSIPRMLLSFFPIVIFLAASTRRSAWAHEVALVTFAPVCALGVVVFTRGAWFY